MVTYSLFGRKKESIREGKRSRAGTALKCEKPGRNVLRNVVKLYTSSWLELGKYISVKPFLGLF